MCWVQNKDERPISFIKTDKINKEEYYNYIDSIEQKKSNWQMRQTKKFFNLTL